MAQLERGLNLHRLLVVMTLSSVGAHFCQDINLGEVNSGRRSVLAASQAFFLYGCTNPLHIINSYIFIAVNSDGTVTREDDTSSLTTSHGRFEVVQVNALTTQDMFHNTSTVQGTPSYIIQAPAGQTYIIQQPAGNLVRQTHTGELTTGSEGIDSNQHDQVMIKV